MDEGSGVMFVGKLLYGYCGGYFGRDSYDVKRIEAIGADWVVVRENSRPNFASFESTEKMMKLIKDWGKPKEEEE